ncbi:MAG TPA: PDZ domain-containing protein [Turneriella sp.]|nr:PDZ domain-containing protein [Turneriella sp.]HNN01254.1 PDZ domain-containing protein [Turneriella sp.]
MALAELRNIDSQGLKRRALQLREVALGLVSRIRYSRTWWYSGAAVLLAFSLARVGHSVALYLVAKGTPLPPPRAAAQQSTSSEQLFSDPTITVGGALFQRAGEGAAAPGAAAVVEQPAKPFKLTATLEGNAEFARALIEVQGEGIREYCVASNFCRRKECECSVQSATIISIAQEHIWIKMNQNRYKLKIGQSTTDLAQQAAAQPAAGPQAGPTQGTVISKVISREEVNKNILGNPAKIYEGAQFGPHLVNGKIEGYKIARVNEDHVFAKLGAKSGDIIRKVNGYGLNDTERMLDLWKAIRTAPEVKIELERDGKVITYDFQIRN